MILDNFNYFNKDNYSPRAFEQKIEDLVNRSVISDDTHLRILAIRQHFDLNVGQMAGLLNVTTETVQKYESTKNVPASYVVHVCNRFDISLKFFSNSPLDLFKERLIENSQFSLKKEII
jgi:DNA-binding transcriptional regulator YiaG